MQHAHGHVSARPRISVVMANFEAGDKIVAALDSVLGQTVSDLELIVSDDASQDHSVALVRARTATDLRLRLIENSTNGGPARCRNQALAIARGEWVAIVDSDDIIHPERFERLLAAAQHHQADIVADDLLLFHEDGSLPRLMLGEEARGSFRLSARNWVLAGLDGSPALGYLKPMIRAERLGQVRYDESLRIGEDYDLVLRLLLASAHMVLVAEPFYLYRRHSGSISHRLSVADMQAMAERQEALAASHRRLPPDLSEAFAQRLAVLRSGLSYEHLVAAIKKRDLAGALGAVLREPANLRRLLTSFNEGRQRRKSPPLVKRNPDPVVLGSPSVAAATTVPNYVPSHLVDWSAPRPRTLWRELAQHAKAPCTALDDAGRYAAGFIPEVILQKPQVQS